ncbi:MAG: hypothetical protein KatS3mg082_1384 [Nitrospiraceae bacterium]|nr:MAG: hypothetical protein KatS3mg082_1384 [Nitrospiraceae bacterium]
MGTVVPVASGKGGVGKTAIAAMLAREAARLGPVVAFDADPLPNLDILLRPLPPRCQLRRTTATAVDEIESAAESAFVVVDLGAGLDSVDLFARLSSVLLVVTPDEASRRDAEAYLRLAAIRRLTHEFFECRGWRDIEEYWHAHPEITMGQLIGLLERPEFITTAEEALSGFTCYLIGNQCEPRHARLLDDFARVLSATLAPLVVRPVGVVPFDPAVRRATVSGGLRSGPAANEVARAFAIIAGNGHLRRRASLGARIRALFGC